MEAKIASDPDFRAEHDAAAADYAESRATLIEIGSGPMPDGGVGGTREGVKCLHAHYAHAAAGGANPVGRLVGEWIEPLDCVVPCVVEEGLNPEWSSSP